jgi:hypothetical protein
MIRTMNLRELIQHGRNANSPEEVISPLYVGWPLTFIGKCQNGDMSDSTDPRPLAAAMQPHSIQERQANGYERDPNETRRRRHH